MYRVEGAPPTWRQRLRAVSLWAARGYALSHHTAAALHGLRHSGDGPVELSVTRNLKLPPPARVYRVAELSHRELSSIEGFRVTSMTRTLVDLSALVQAPWLRAALDQALCRRWTTLERLEVALARASSHRGVVTLRSQVQELLGGEAPTESALEARVAEVLDAAALPRATRQHLVRVAGRVRRMDFRIPGTPIVIEADGYAFHSSLEAFERDRRRNNELIARGFRVLHWTWAAVRDRPDELLEELMLTLRSVQRAAGP